MLDIFLRYPRQTHRLATVRASHPVDAIIAALCTFPAVLTRHPGHVTAVAVQTTRQGGEVKDTVYVGSDLDPDNGPWVQLICMLGAMFPESLRDALRVMHLAGHPQAGPEIQLLDPTPVGQSPTPTPVQAATRPVGEPTRDTSRDDGVLEPLPFGLGPC